MLRKRKENFFVQCFQLGHFISCPVNVEKSQKFEIGDFNLGHPVCKSSFPIYRSKNTVNILIKNWLDMCIGALVYWAVGFALTFGNSFGRFLGTSYFFFVSMPGNKHFICRTLYKRYKIQIQWYKYKESFFILGNLKSF